MLVSVPTGLNVGGIKAAGYLPLCWGVKSSVVLWSVGDQVPQIAGDSIVLGYEKGLISHHWL